MESDHESGVSNRTTPVKSDHESGVFNRVHRAECDHESGVFNRAIHAEGDHESGVSNRAIPMEGDHENGVSNRQMTERNASTTTSSEGSKMTSTPLKIKVRRKVKLLRNKRRKNKVRLEALNQLKRRLDEGRDISLSPSSEQDEEGNSVAHEAEANEDVDNSPEFQTMSSSIAEELHGMLSELERSDNNWSELSDPDLEGVLINLTGAGPLSNPFQLSLRIRRELLRRAREAEGRAVEWDLSSFDKVGGAGTLRSLWDSLKGLKKVRGVKRGPTSVGLLTCGGRKKKRLNGVEGQEEHDGPDVHDVDMASGEDDRLSERELPYLTSSSETSDTDSGLSESVGQVTNLCRDRRPDPTVSSGKITRTGMMLPVSIGFSDASVSSDDWEEVYDLSGNPTGVEVLEIGIKRLGIGEDETDDGYMDRRVMLEMGEMSRMI